MIRKRRCRIGYSTTLVVKLTATLMLVGCTRAELPVVRYAVARSPAALSSCVFRHAQQNTGGLEVVTQTRLDEPVEYQVAKTSEGVLLWELDASPAEAGNSSLTTRHYPGLVKSWDADMMKSLKACTGDAPLRRL